MIFLPLVNLCVVQKSKQVKLYLKLSTSADKILSSLIEKVWCACTFQNYFRESNEKLLCALFQ